MKKISEHYILAALLLFVTIVFASVKAYPAEIVEWDLSPDGSMVVTYRTITKGVVTEESFKHKIIGHARKLEGCKEVRVVGSELWLVTQESEPSRYMIELRPYERLKEVYIVRKPYLDWVK